MSSNSGVNTGCAKCFIIFMATVILLQGAVYLALSIWGIIRVSCPDGAIHVSEKPFDFVMDIIYFADKNCGDPTIALQVAGHQLQYELKMDWDKSEIITNREHIFLIVYIVISAIWVITSASVLTTICGTVTATVSALCYWPWFLGVMAGSILDAVVTGYHIHDVVHTTSSTSAFEYIGVTVDDPKVSQTLSTFDAYFMTPALVMAIVSSRVFFIWLLNIFGTCFCLSISNVLAKRAKANKRRNIPPTTTQNIPVPAETVERPTTSQNQQQEPIQQQYMPEQHEYIEQHPPQIKPKPLLIQPAIGPAIGQVNRQSSYQQQPQQYQREDRRTLEPLKAPVDLPTAPSPSASDPRSPLNKQAITINEFPTYRNAETHPDKLDYPPQDFPGLAAPAEMRATSPELSIVTPLNSRYSVQEAPHYSHHPPPRVNDALRSQLPWSYTSVLGNPPQPPQRRTQSQMVSPPPPPPNNKMYPEVPEPDYTLHPHRDAHSVPNNNEINIQQPQTYSRW